MPLESLREAIDTAYAWNGGGGSPLYGFASRRLVASDDHSWGLIREIRRCMALTNDLDDHLRLESLHALVLGLAIGHQVCTYGDMSRHWAH